MTKEEFDILLNRLIMRAEEEGTPSEAVLCAVEAVAAELEISIELESAGGDA